jgi:hypothetical protein
MNGDRLVIILIQHIKNQAGNFYTNEKAGSSLSLLCWVSPRTIKEIFVTPTDYRYPFF